MGTGQIPAAVRPTVPPARLIDLDVATESEIQGLPRIGPALAHRIVANRDSAGPFGGVQAFRRVRGVGPATLKLLAPLVTFSGQTRR
jgi:competence protein ComEA